MLKHIPLIIRTALYAFFGLYALFAFFPQIDPDIELFFQTYKLQIFYVLLLDIGFTLGQGWEQRKFRKRCKELGVCKHDPKRSNFTSIQQQEKNK